MIEKKQDKVGAKVKFDIDTQKEVAKIGMTASLAVLVATSFNLKPKISKQLHVISGATLVGFSFWHHMLYQNKTDTKNKNKKLSAKK
ncbi:hypothetical protein [Campylobacter geochelonis]|uniref:hypothetical protein n=1 Tax=Campylobacter geochelonis TaxID=1780362 RepID=UPI001F6157D0|nr:hypothetical protein [Campylobacter geochelonis]